MFEHEWHERIVEDSVVRYFDRLAGQLSRQPLPVWSERYAQLAPAYPSWT